MLRDRILNKDISTQNDYLFLAIIVFIIMAFLLPREAGAMSIMGSSSSVPAAAMKLVEFGDNAGTVLDVQSLATLVDYVLESKTDKEIALPAAQKATGAYYEFDTKINFINFLRYAYSNQIPSILTSPGSLRYSMWKGDTQKLPASWKLPPPGAKPLIIRGFQRDGITPDLTTEVYYEYDLKRTLILFNHKGKNVFISVSKQLNVSDVGRKGVILGSDDDWNYCYLGEPGSIKSGMGWVKSYIYDYFSVTVYVEPWSSASVVRTGVFQWIRAGWSGINFVQSEHIIKGIKRYSRNLKTVMESPCLPVPNQLASTYQKFFSLPHHELVERYTTLQQARRAMANQSGKINTSEIKKQDSHANISKEQIIEELMLEYLKIILGKPSLLGKKSSWLIIN